MNKLLQIFALCFAVLLMLSCRGDEPKRMPDTVPDIIGDIASLTETGGDKKNIRLQMMVKATQDTKTSPSEASIKVTEDTLIEDKDGKRLKAGQLQQGQQVEVWFEGPVMESMPAQATAKAIRISSNPRVL